jgi:hypothetical protein
MADAIKVWVSGFNNEADGNKLVKALESLGFDIAVKMWVAKYSYVETVITKCVELTTDNPKLIGEALRKAVPTAQGIIEEWNGGAVAHDLPKTTVFPTNGTPYNPP